MVYSDPYIHLSETDSHVNYDLPRIRGNVIPSDWKDRIWNTLMGYRKNHLLIDSNKRYLIARKQTYLLYQCDVWFGVNIGICYSCNQVNVPFLQIAGTSGEMLLIDLTEEHYVVFPVGGFELPTNLQQIGSLKRSIQVLKYCVVR